MPQITDVSCCQDTYRSRIHQMVAEPVDRVRVDITDTFHRCAGKSGGLF